MVPVTLTLTHTFEKERKMKRIFSFTIALIFVSLMVIGCYLHTPVETRGAQYLPKKDYHSIGVIFKDITGKARNHMDALKVVLYRELESRGFVVKFLDNVSGIDEIMKNPEVLGDKIPDLVLEVDIVKYGEESQLVETPATSTIMSSSASQGQDHIIAQPWDKDSSAYCESEFKTVIMQASLVDVLMRNRIWSARAEAKPRVVGCSFLYKSYNKSLNLLKMAKKTLRELMSKFPRR